MPYSFEAQIAEIARTQIEFQKNMLALLESQELPAAWDSSKKYVKCFLKTFSPRLNWEGLKYIQKHGLKRTVDMCVSVSLNMMTTVNTEQSEALH